MIPLTGQTIKWMYNCPESMIDPLSLSLEMKRERRLSNNRIIGNEFSCPRCNRSYKVKRSLRRHLIVECDYEKRKMFYMTSGNRGGDRRRSRGQGRFACENCDRRYHQVHMMKHGKQGFVPRTANTHRTHDNNGNDGNTKNY
ncbi:hypothetical protein HZH66_010634 [Vespula vulgaris]|uniref:C2H2-type domain-containing protein n=1 Tax=Vespula vulgaris TaxID=7454 RepID=A0A834JIQ3_VESVU|nr:hypothetical protein HZH66_010634 [Vespula vulgaris]